MATGPIPRDYDVVEVVMALQGATKWEEAWATVLQAIRSDALRLGCDAIVSLQLEHRVYLKQQTSYFGTNNIQGVELFAYGTAVKFRDSSQRR